MANLLAALRRMLHPTSGAAVIFDGLARLSRLGGGRTERSPDELRGAQGCIVFDFGTDGAWTMEVRAGRVFFRRGVAPTSRATVAMESRELLALLDGTSSFMVSQMSGKIRIRGDGHAGLVLGNVVADIRANAAKAGIRGWLARRWIHRARQVEERRAA